MKKGLLVIFTLAAFAANSVLCRIALKEGHADPATFSSLRLLGGAVVLLFFQLAARSRRGIQWNVVNAGLLTAYAFLFSLAYVHLNTATGALLLFGAVQVCMILWGIIQGEKPGRRKIAGIAVAITGMAVLLLPGASMPSPIPAIMMIASGLAWGAYSVRGKKVADPTGATTGNFLLSVPVIALLFMLSPEPKRVDSDGVALALVSGGVASAVAYVLWYRIVRHLTSTTASTLQLSVPCLAALGGVFFLKEMPDLRMIFATALVIAGIVMVIASDRAAAR
ncbi:DMT family transporter [Franconibacter sp. IITDAS19]|uniref:DMT family transporter n=1 Tax=Franconibacter sp. IITDAS19 TaxID=2930569 RepID=UPI001FFB936B|nr:DMT family transporter [Franconibacter sp. IITDAS19]MCK1967947.1 DMT family transporter [Franconibacter sp. IITDAS19]